MYNITAKRPGPEHKKTICITGIKSDSRAEQLVRALVHEGYKVTIVEAKETGSSSMERAAKAVAADMKAQDVISQISGVSPVLRGEPRSEVIPAVPLKKQQDHPERCVVD